MYPQLNFPSARFAKMPAATALEPEIMGSETEGKSEWKETAG